MKVTDNRKITVEIGGTKHNLTLDEAQELYDAIGNVNGIRRPYWNWDPSPQWTCPITISSGVSTVTAQGGYVNSGQIYLVGEAGAETVATDGPDEDDPPLSVAV